MDLAHHTANPGAIASDNNEQVLGSESHLLIHAYDLNVSESLAVRTHLILAFDDENAAAFQDSVRLDATALIQVQYRLVIFAFSLISAPVVSIVPLKWRVGDVSRSSRRMHVRRVEYNAVDFAVAIRQLAAINAALNVSRTQIVYALQNVSPKNAPPIRYIYYRAAWLHIKLEDFREHGVIAVQMSAKNKLVRRVSISDDALLSADGRFLDGDTGHWIQFHTVTID